MPSSVHPDLRVRRVERRRSDVRSAPAGRRRRRYQRPLRGRIPWMLQLHYLAIRVWSREEGGERLHQLAAEQLVGSVDLLLCSEDTSSSSVNQQLIKGLYIWSTRTSPQGPRSPVDLPGNIWCVLDIRVFCRVCEQLTFCCWQIYSPRKPNIFWGRSIQQQPFYIRFWRRTALLVFQSKVIQRVNNAWPLSKCVFHNVLVRNRKCWQQAPAHRPSCNIRFILQRFGFASVYSW